MKDLDPALAEEISRKVNQRVRSEETQAEVKQAVEDTENTRLRQNIEELRTEKRRLEEEKLALGGRLRSLESQNLHYRTSCARPNGGTAATAELRGLQEALDAVQTVTATLNSDNERLQQRLQAVAASQEEARQKKACVVCLDNLPNVVCLPCRHMALCSFCCDACGLTSCPICRGLVESTVQVCIP